MPELPEVETIRRGLQQYLPGRRVEAVRVREPRLRWPVDEDALHTWALGRHVREVDRRAKYLLIHLQGGGSLVLHLGMSGRLLMVPRATELEKHDHVIFGFDDGRELRFRDPRRFGMVDAVPTETLATYVRFRDLGVEPLTGLPGAEALHERMRRSHKPIKNVLMDAQVLVGVGNIYANEALFYAGLHPTTPARDLSAADWRGLLEALRRVLEDAIEAGGTTVNDFMDSNGEIGYFQLSLAVYGRAGEPCPRCGTAIERLVLAGRSSFFCPQCQVLPQAVAPAADR